MAYKALQGHRVDAGGKHLLPALYQADSTNWTQNTP